MESEGSVPGLTAEGVGLAPGARDKEQTPPYF